MGTSSITTRFPVTPASRWYVVQQGMSDAARPGR
jgi:hypothetical protein